MSFPAIQVANEILKKYGENGIDPLKLQKLLYYANGWWLAIEGEPLLDEQPQVWRHGPVFRSIYRIFARYKWQYIDHPEPVSPFSDKINLVETKDRKKFDAFLDWLWIQYGKKSGTELSEETHAEGTPWRNIAERCKFKVPENTVIPVDEDREYFATLAKERGFSVAA
jgi:uncharacterized phage-associated protein